jgi:hypothetical protein
MFRQSTLKEVTTSVRSLPVVTFNKSTTREKLETSVQDLLTYDRCVNEKKSPHPSAKSAGATSFLEARTHGLLGVGRGWAPPIMVTEFDVHARTTFTGIKAHEYNDTPEVLQEKVRLLAALLRQSENAIAYTGAGISTAAGIGKRSTMRALLFEACITPLTLFFIHAYQTIMRARLRNSQPQPPVALC